MKAILYAGLLFRTDERVADALVDFAAELVERGRKEIVTIPVLVDGFRTEARLIIGDAIAIAALGLPHDGVDGELDSNGTVEELHSRVEALRRGPNLPLDDHPDPPAGDFFTPA